MKLIRKQGATSEIWQVFIQDSSSTTGAGLTGLAFNTSGLTAYYHRDTDSTATAISLVTMTVGVFTSSGFKEIDSVNLPGFYQICPPNAVLASGAKSAIVMLKGAANMAPLPIEIDLDSQVDVTFWTGSGISSPATAGVPDINVKNINNVAAATPGASGGILISGSNAGTTTLAALTVSGATTLTGNVALAAGLTITQSTTNGSAISLTGNGTGAGFSSTGGSGGNGATITGGATGNGMALGGGVTSGNGLDVQASGGGYGIYARGTTGTFAGIYARGSTSGGAGIETLGGSAGAGMLLTAGNSGIGFSIVAGSTSGVGINVATTSGDGISVTPTAGNAIVLTANGTSKHGMFITGGTAGTSDGIHAVAGTGGVDIRGNITGNLVGTVSTVTTVTAVTGLTASNLDATISSRMASYTQPTGFLAATFPSGTIANTTNITAGTITTVTTVTNQLTAAQIATGVWQDATAGDFTVGNSVGKSVYTGVAPGASGGHFIAGTNAATTVTSSFTTTFTGNLTGNVGGSVGSVTALVTANVTEWNFASVATPNLAGVPLVEVTRWNGANVASNPVAGVPRVDMAYINGTVSAGTAGYVGIDWAAIVNQSSTANLIGTTVQTVVNVSGNISGSVASVTGNVGGNVTGSVGSVVAAVSLSAGDSPVLQSGTATAGSSTTITIQTAIGADNLPIGCVIKITSGTGTKQARVITGYINSTKVVTVDRAWVTNPDATSVYTIMYAEQPKLEASLKVSGVLLVDTCTTNTDMRGTDAAALASVWSATRGTYVDNLNVGGAVASHADITGLNNITAASVWAVSTRIVTAATNITSDGGTISQTQLAHLDADVSSRMASYTQPTGFLAATFPSTVAKGIVKNAILNNFAFYMRLGNSPATGLTVLAQRAIDGGSFATCANAVSELANGVYLINLAAADLNGSIITLKFTATGADESVVVLLTSP